MNRKRRIVLGVVLGITIGIAAAGPVAAVPVGEDVAFEVQSAGSIVMKRNGNTFYSKGGGGGGGRGFNVAVISPIEGKLREPVINFDTWSGGETVMTQFIDYLNGVQAGDIVLLGVADEAGLNFPHGCRPITADYIEEAYQAIEALGATLIREYCWRSSYALIAVKGVASARSEATALTIGGLRDPVTVSADFTFNLFDSVTETRGNLSVRHRWQAVEFEKAPAVPVVILGIPTRFGRDPGVGRVRNVSPLGFEARFEEWDYLVAAGVGGHKAEWLPYLLLQQGRFSRSDGGLWEVGTFEANDQWTRLDFKEPFAARPFVFATAQTTNGSMTVTVRVRNVGRRGFDAALWPEEALSGPLVPETVGFLAMAAPDGPSQVFFSSGEVPYALQVMKLDHRFAPVIGGEVQLQEEQSEDEETQHGMENVHILSFGDQLFGQITTVNEEDSVALRQRPRRLP